MIIHHIAGLKDNSDNIVTVGSKKFTSTEIEKLYAEGKKYFASYSKLYVIEYSSASKLFYVREFYKPLDKLTHFTKRGRVEPHTGSEINEILGFKLINED